MSAPLTREQALSILDIFGGQYPWSDVSGYLLALEALGLVDHSVTQPVTAAVDTPTEAVVAGAVAPSGQASDAPATTTPVAPEVTTPAPTQAPVETPTPTPNPDGSPAA